MQAKRKSAIVAVAALIVFVLVVRQLQRDKWSERLTHRHQRHPRQRRHQRLRQHHHHLTFNDNIQPGASYANITLNKGTSTPLTFTPVINGNTLTITPTANLPYNYWIQLIVPTDAVVNTAGTPLAYTYIMAFTTSIS